jgi:sugar phosphate isomerase/epimerase
MTMDPRAPTSAQVLLGTVAIEPNRWGMAKPDGAPVTVVSEWLDAIAAAGFDGLELWERHATWVDAGEVDKIAAGPIPVVIFNGYALWDDPDPGAREATAAWVRRFGATGVKFNLGNDPSARDAYVERLRRFHEQVDPSVRLLCECHEGTLADDPAIAAGIFDAVASRERLQAIVHLHRKPHGVAAFMDGYGDRVGHVHVQLAEEGPDTDPAALADDLREGVELLRSFGFAGSWTIEFAYGRMTDHDEAGYILRWATRDLRALREALSP